MEPSGSYNKDYERYTFDLPDLIFYQYQPKMIQEKIQQVIKTFFGNLRGYGFRLFEGSGAPWILQDGRPQFYSCSDFQYYFAYRDITGEDVIFLSYNWRQRSANNIFSIYLADRSFLPKDSCQQRLSFNLCLN